MKPRCPTKCGRELGDSNVLCGVCWDLVPIAMRNEIANAAAIVKKCRTANLMSAAFSRQSQARTRAIQYVIDLNNAKAKVPA